MNEEIIVSIAINIILTAGAYLCVPVIIGFTGKKRTAKQIKRIIFINGAIVWLIFAFIRAENNIQGSGASVFLWSAVAHWILKANCLKEEKPSTSNNQITGNYNIMSEEVYLDPSNTDNGVEPKLNHNNYSLSVDPANTEIKANRTPTVIQTNVSAQLTCKKCGKEYDSSFAFCPYCGKKSRKKKHTFLIVSIALILVCALAFFAHTAITKAKLEEIRNNAFEAMYNQDFSKAKYYLDQYPDAQSTFMSEYAYVQAGILLEEGHYLDALKEFKKLTYPVPASIMEGLEDKVYNLGVRSYHQKSYSLAQRQFIAVAGYKRSEDYITLCETHLTYSDKNYNKLIRLIGFEDVNEILMNGYTYADKFLEGTWKTQDNSHYFTMREDGKTSYNLPSVMKDGTYWISNSVYTLTNKDSSMKECFKFTIVEEDIIKVFCFKNNKTYKMYRQ